MAKPLIRVKTLQDATCCFGLYTHDFTGASKGPAATRRKKNVRINLGGGGGWEVVSRRGVLTGVSHPLGRGLTGGQQGKEPRRTRMHRVSILHCLAKPDSRSGRRVPIHVTVGHKGY
jgi:hypothetical protein